MHWRSRTELESFLYKYFSLNTDGYAAAQQILANNAADQIIAAHGPFLQIEQKKVLVFHGEKDKVTVMVIAWFAHMEAVADVGP